MAEAAVDFASILDTPASDVERPKPLPVGQYYCVVKGLPRMDKSSKKQTEFAEFTLIPQQAMDENMLEAIDEAGGLEGKTIRATFYLTENALWRLKDFLVEDLGIEQGSKSIGQMINEAPGRTCLATLKHRASEDGKAIFAELSSTAPAQE